MKLNMTVEEFLKSWSPSDGGYYPLDVYPLEEKKMIMLSWGLSEEELSKDAFIKECTDGYVVSVDGIASISPGIEWKGFTYYTNQFGEYCIRPVINYALYECAD